MIFSSRVLRIREKTEALLTAYTTPSSSFFLLMTLASAIVAFGLIMNNTAVIIGGMVVAPLITPIFGFSLSLILFKIKRIGISLLSILIGTAVAFLTAVLSGYLVIFLRGSAYTTNLEILTRVTPTLLFFMVAFFSGMAGAYAYTRPKIISSITGIAISVAIVPPIAVTGLMIPIQQWTFAEQSFLLYCLNLAGITFGSIAMFLFLGFGKDIDKA